MLDDEVTIGERVKWKAREVLDGLWDLRRVTDVKSACEGAEAEVRAWLEGGKLPRRMPARVDDGGRVDDL